MENQKPDESEYVFPHIPYEILVEILLRLPATSIVRFKSVSKPWHALFSTQEFMTAHLEINRDNKKLIKYGYICAHSRRTLKLFSLESLLKDPITPSGSKMNDSYLDIESDACMMCSCDGLICFFKKPNHIWIWNPATRKCRKLPVLMPKKPGCLEFIGFGYYEPANDYKVVAIQCPYDVDVYDYEDDCVLQVYSLYAHRWETVKYYASVFATPSPYAVSGVFLNNKPYWLENPDAEGICYFDLASCEFEEIEEPHGVDCVGAGYFSDVDGRSLAVLDGHLCLGYDRKTSLDLWLLKENANKEYTWTKFVSINHPCVLDVLHISKKGGILTMVEDKCRKRWLMLYDSKVSSQRMLAIPTHVEVQMKALIYVESLISI